MCFFKPWMFSNSINFHPDTYHWLVVKKGTKVFTMVLNWKCLSLMYFLVFTWMKKNYKLWKGTSPNLFGCAGRPVPQLICGLLLQTRGKHWVADTPAILGKTLQYIITSALQFIGSYFTTKCWEDFKLGCIFTRNEELYFL